MKFLVTTLLLSVLFCLESTAQVGIGNTNPKSTLDITASNSATPANTDGILIPRINAFPVTAPTAAQNGMMVFLTTNSSFYFWKQSTTSWVNITGTGAEKIDDLSDGKSDNDGSQNGSSIFLGINAGVVDDLTNNQNVGIGFEALKVNTDGYSNAAVGYKSLTTNTSGLENTAVGNNSLTLNEDGQGNASIGFNSLSSNTSGNSNVAVGSYSMSANTTGYNNVAVGRNVMSKNKTGYYNVAIGDAAFSQNVNGIENISIGRFSLSSNSDGSGNVAVGDRAMVHNSSGSFATAIGYSAMMNNANNVFSNFNNFNVALGYEALLGAPIPSSNTGNFNTAIGAKVLSGNVNGNNNTVVGYQSFLNNTSGGNNSAIGFESGLNNATGIGNIFFGYQAGYNETGSNKLYIENSNANATNALIYGEFDNNILRVNGELQINNPSTTGFKFPTARGTNNQVLKTNASGVLTWADEVDGTDHDFYKVGTTLPPTTINDDMFTHGKMGINKAVPTSSLDIVDARGKTAFNLYVDDTSGFSGASPTYGIKSTIDNTNDTLATGITIGISNTIDALNEGIGVENVISGHIASAATFYGTKQTLSNSGSGEVYGIYNSLSGPVSGNKYGSYNLLTGGSGTNFGVYSESLTGFAGYFLGKVSIGRNAANTYSFPDSRAAGNGEIMLSDATGIVTWNKFTNLGWGTRGNSGLNSTQDFIGTTDNVGLSFRTNNTQKMQLTTSGNLKIITAADDEAQIKNGNSFNDAADASINFSVNETKDAWMVSSREGTTDNSGIYGNRDFITMWSPGDSNRIVRFLDEDSWTDNDGDPYNFTAEKAYIDQNGQYVQASDRNRKENIKNITNALDKIKSLNGYIYTYKLNTSEKQKGQKATKTSGVIAQELYEILPEAVQINESGEYFVHYAGIIPLLIEAIKEQQKQISKLKELELRILKLEKQ